MESIGDERQNPQDLHIGDRVGVPWLYSACGSANSACRGKKTCARRRVYRLPRGRRVCGIYAGRRALRAAPEISDEQAAPLLCAGIIGYRSLRQADVHPGERVGLVGFGASAHLAIQVARGWGCEVYVFTRSEEHRRHAEQLGAAWTGGIEEHPQPLDRAVIFAPSGKLVPLALEKLRPGGTLAINAIHMSDIPEMPYRLIYGERTLRSVANATYQDGVEFLRIASEMGIRSSVTIYPLEEANQALLDLKHSQINGEAVLAISQVTHR